MVKPGRICVVEDFSNETLENIVEHLEVSTQFDHFVYRESELDSVYRLVEMAIKETPSTDIHASRRLAEVFEAVVDAHNLVGDERPEEAAARLRQLF